MSNIAMIYCPPIKNRYKDTSLKVAQIRPRKRVKLASTTCNKLRSRPVPLNAIFSKMKYLWGTHMRVGSLFMKLKSFLSRYLKFGPTITSNLKLKHTRGKQHYQRLGSEEHVKSRRQQTFTLGKRRARLGSLRRFRVRLRCLSPIPLLKRLIDASVKISLAASEKGYPGGLVMPHQLSFPISAPVGQVHY